MDRNLTAVLKNYLYSSNAIKKYETDWQKGMLLLMIRVNLSIWNAIKQFKTYSDSCDANQKICRYKDFLNTVKYNS